MALKKVNNTMTTCEPQKCRFWILKLIESTFIQVSKKMFSKLLILYKSILIIDRMPLKST